MHNNRFLDNSTFLVADKLSYLVSGHCSHCTMAAIKKRATNFKGDEKRVLWTVLKGFYTIVENKKTDKITTKLKDQAWLEIANRYNAFGSGITRDTRQLRTFYDNWRRKVKKIFLEENTATMQTSGVSTILDDVDLELLGLIEDKISPLENPYDSDAIQGKLHNIDFHRQTTVYATLFGVFHKYF